MNKANPEKIWTTVWIFWISLAHIQAYFPTIDHKTKKTAKSILLSAHGWSFAKTTMQGISSFNFLWFQQPIRSCGIVLTANQHCSQNLAAVSANLWEFVSAPILAVAVSENVWEPLKLSLISGYENPNLKGSLVYTLLLGNHLNVLCLMLVLSSKSIQKSIKIDSAWWAVSMYECVSWATLL